MYSKTTPYPARIKERSLLTSPFSTKKTYHIVLDIAGSALSFNVGDSIGVLPTNDPKIVDEILGKLGVEDESLKEFLLYKANLSKVSFHKILPVEKTSTHLLHLLDRHKPSPEELRKALLPLMPRFYSIASSPKVFPDEIHLTVATTEYEIDGAVYQGVGSYFLSELADGATPIPIYVQPSHHFRLPPPEVPMVMIGPGTGIAPFRAFVQERLATQATGLNWLFFGERNRASDFYYSDFWLDLEAQGRLRLNLAFSRDQEEKIYVQHRMLEEKKSLWDWIQKGCYIYVCGDAEKMAKDVDLALLQIVKEEGSMTEEEARKFLRSLRIEKRYLLDVY
jgi:sulfite reductase (NADPH) flavoprotein alpha-component